MGDLQNPDMLMDATPVCGGADTWLPSEAAETWVDRTSARESFLMVIAEECRMGSLVIEGTTPTDLPYQVEYRTDDRGKPYLHGWCKVRQASGLLAAFGRYEKGARHGVWYFWGHHGELLDEVIYNEGVREEYVVCRSRRGVPATA